MNNPDQRKKGKSELAKIPQTILARQWSLAKLSLRAGSSYVGRRIANGIVAGDKSASTVALDVIADQVKNWVAELGKLKGSAQKAGQMLSVYGEYFLSPEINAALKELQSNSPPISWKQMEQQLKRSLGAPALASLDVNSMPAGSASIGQVHRAIIKSSSEEIALKIQYPGVSKATDSDLAALRAILNFANLGIQSGAMDKFFSEIRRMLNQEMDYKKELQFTQEYFNRLANDSQYIVPRPYPEFSGKQVLATKWVNGVDFDSTEFLSISQERKDRIGRLFLDLYFRELFVWGEMQTDPHQGNYKAALDPLGLNDRLICFDFGATRKIEPSFLNPYRAMLKAALQNNSREFLENAEKLEFLQESDPDSLYLLFWQTCRMIVEPFLPEADRSPESIPFFSQSGEYDFGKSDLPDRLIIQARKLIRGFWNRLPPHQIIFLDRKLAGTYLFLKSINAKIDGAAAIHDYL